MSKFYVVGYERDTQNDYGDFVWELYEDKGTPYFQHYETAQRLADRLNEERRLRGNAYEVERLLSDVEHTRKIWNEYQVLVSAGFRQNLYPTEKAYFEKYLGQDRLGFYGFQRSRDREWTVETLEMDQTL